MSAPCRCDRGGKIKKEITLKLLRTEDIRARLTSRLIGRVYSRPCSNFSWQAIQCLAHGTASNRFCCISSWQLAQTPYSSSWMRFSAASIRFKRSEEHTSELQSRFDLVC